MAAPILKIGKDPITLTIKKAKVVSGQFGNQLWCPVQDHAGDEAIVYLPWANNAGGMSGVVQQFIRTNLISPEDFTNVVDTYIEQLHDQTFVFERVFKDGSQFINAKLAGGASPTKNAAIRELDLQQQQDDSDFARALGTKPAPQPTATLAPKKPKESADARIARAFEHVMETYAPRLAELDPELVRAIVALTATHAIAYEKE